MPFDQGINKNPSQDGSTSDDEFPACHHCHPYKGVEWSEVEWNGWIKTQFVIVH